MHKVMYKPNFNKKTEILVFDDCSTDNSLSILKKYQNKILYIKNSKKNILQLHLIKYLV